MKQILATVGGQNPQSMRELLSSVTKNELNGWQVHIQLHFNDCLHEYFDLIHEILGPYDFFIAVNQNPLGHKEHPHYLLNNVFETGSDICIFLQEGIVVSPDITDIANWYIEQELMNILCLNCCLAGCDSNGFVSDPEYADIFVKTKIFNGDGLIITGQQWSKHFKLNWFCVPEYFLNRYGEHKDRWDIGILNYLLMENQLKVIQPIFARARKVSVQAKKHEVLEGINYSKELPILLNKVTSHYRVCEDYEKLPSSLYFHLNLWQEISDYLSIMPTLVMAKRRLDMLQKIFKIKSNRHLAWKLVKVIRDRVKP